MEKSIKHLAFGWAIAPVIRHKPLYSLDPNPRTSISNGMSKSDHPSACGAYISMILYMFTHKDWLLICTCTVALSGIIPC